MARNIKLTLEYDGTDYVGWQVQPGLPTVHGVLVEGLKKITGEEVALIASGRTDAGVHALGQVANFKTTSSISVDGIRDGLNSVLPKDVAITEALEVPPGFDSRRDARSKTYAYRVLRREHRSPVLGRFSWHVDLPLDTDVMSEGAALLVGRKDFSSFRAADSDAAHSVREIFSFDVGKEGDMIELRVRGTGFLRHMVRAMVAALVELGSGRITLADLARIVEARSRAAAPWTAPARGLFLMEVEY
ncbi:MAG: tRNA pseudouridine(38-40) synthase TruA [Thermodesulfobacteriota bacterium]